MKPVYLLALGVVAPGMPTWGDCRAVLRGEAAYQPAALSVAGSQLLPANERRRAPLAVRLAFAAAEDCMREQAVGAADCATVFASSDADTPIIHRICAALAEPNRIISPTDFHNCVHNAAAGYWSIAVGSQRPSCSLSGHDGSFASGLLEAAALAHGDGETVLLVAYDIPPPEPLLGVRPILQPFATALLLSAQPSAGAFALELSLGDAAISACAAPALEQLRQENPAARALPLLTAIAQGGGAGVLLPLPMSAATGSLRVECARVA